MFKVLKYAKQLWYIMLVILALLFVQVYCELTLPGYTSDIVDVGIQNKGVEYPIPEKISEDTFERLTLFLTEEELSVVENAYRKNKDVYEVNLKSLEEQEYENLEDSMLVPELMLYLFTADSEEAQAVQQQMFAAIGGTTGAIQDMDIL